MDDSAARNRNHAADVNALNHHELNRLAVRCALAVHRFTGPHQQQGVLGNGHRAFGRLSSLSLGLNLGLNLSANLIL